MAKNDSNKRSGKSSKSDGPRKAVTSDPRFSRVHNDPRFNLPKRRDMKVTIDERFKTKMANEEDFKRKNVVDKYGRKIARDSSERELKKYYNMEDDDDKKKGKKGSEDEEESEASESGSEADSESSDSETEGKTIKKGSQMAAKAKKSKVPELASASESESEESSEEEEVITGNSRARGEDSDISESSDEDSSEEELEEEELVIEEQEIPQGDETKTIAVVNLDWDNVRAVDLMATFSSFVPSRGRIDSVQIFPSEYGKMRMEQENIEGPAPELFANKNKKKKKHDSDDEEITTKDLIEEDDGEEVDSKTLRKYQLQRLRYYYAVVKCDSIVTARNIYDSCDGTEFEATANFFDLRYVPDDMEFDDESHDQCTMVPADYKPNYFVTDALQHSKVRLTWDETPVERMKLASKAFSQREIDDMDFKAYLASDSDSNASDNAAESKEEMKNKYKSLLSQSEYGSLLEGDSKDDVDMEITFTPGLDSAKVADSESESEKEETTIEKYKRKEKERRQQRMEEWKAKNEQNGQDDKKSKKNSKSKKAQPTAEEAKKTAELELLMMEDDESSKIQHFDMKEIMKAEKKAKRNKNKKKGSKDSEPTGMDFEVDVKDDRFNQLFESHEFAIDPNQPQFKKTSGMEKLLDERRRRTQNKPAAELEEAPAKSKYAKEVFSAAQKRKHEGDQSIQDLIAKVKRRTKK